MNDNEIQSANNTPGNNVVTLGGSFFKNKEPVRGEVIPFPKKAKIFPPQSPEEIAFNMTKARKELIEKCIKARFPEMLKFFKSHGFDLGRNNDSVCDKIFMEEAIRSALYRLCDFPHPIQKMAVKSQTLNKDGFFVFKEIFYDDETPELPDIVA